MMKHKSGGQLLHGKIESPCESVDLVLPFEQKALEIILDEVQYWQYL